MTAAIRPETALLICCARTGADSETAEQLRAWLGQDMDWTYLLHTANRHGVMPLLYRYLATDHVDAVPTAILNQLRKDFQTNAWRNFLLTGELLRTVRLLESHAIPAVPFKGPALAAAAYGDISLRTFKDLDILVHKYDIRRARTLMIAQTYRPLFVRNLAQEAALLRYDNEYLFVQDATGFLVELHWTVTPKHFCLPQDPPSLWERLQPIFIGGQSILTLSPEDLLLVLCVHGAKHGWKRLVWLCDVARLVNSYDKMNWGQVLQRSERNGSQRMLLLGLHLAHNLLGLTLSEAVSKRAQTDPIVRSLAIQIRDNLFQTGDSIRDIFYQCTRLRDKLRYLRHQVITPRPADCEFVSLPPQLSPFYYVVRPLRLLTRYGLLLLGRHDGNSHTN